MRRREVIGFLVGVASWPLGAPAQTPSKLPTIGFLGGLSPLAMRDWVTAFSQRLRELGWSDGRNLVIEYRWAEGRNERAAEIAAEFVRLKVDLIVTGGTANVVAAKDATGLIPIVFAAAGNPVGNGLVASLARPGGNVTGLSNQSTDLAGKQIESLREMIPGLRRLAILANIGTPISALGLSVVALEIRRAEDIEPAFAARDHRADALFVSPDPLVNTHRVRINTLALSARLPTMHTFRESVEAGGLMSYGPNFPELYRRAAAFADKILRGARPADIPVEQPTKFDLILNLTTAKALGLTVPPSLVARADEVIE